MTRPLRVAFVTGDPGSASARARVHERLPGLAARGIAAEVAALPPGRAARRRLFAGLTDHDAVVLHRRLLGPGDLAALRRAARALVFDVDDAVWERPGRPRWRRGRRRLGRLLAAADLVAAGSERLAAALAAAGGRRVRVLRPAAPGPPAAPERPDGDPLTLVWTGSGPTRPYLEALAGPLAAAARGSCVPVRLVAAADAPPRLPGLAVEFRPWSPEAEAEVLTAGDVGLYPLPDDPWSRGKCAYKVLRYMAFGLATAASPHGAGAELLEPAGAGLLAETPAAWRVQLGRLLADPGLRRALGARARRRWVEAHDPEATSARLAALLREAIRLRAGAESC